MIQRIQSVFLFLVSLVTITAILVPMHYLSISIQMEEGNSAISAIGLVQQVVAVDNEIDKTTDYYKVGALAIIGIIAFTTIFLYKNRALQMRLVRLNIIASFLFALGMAYFVYNYFNTIQVIDYSIKPAGCITIASILLLNILALKFIRKDDELVKSADRFR